MLEAVRFQGICEFSPVLRIESGGLGNPLGPVVPNIDVVIPRKAKPQRINIRINFFLEIIIF